MINDAWNYKLPSDILGKNSLHVQVIADFGGGLTTDHAFEEVRNHFFRFDNKRIIRAVSEHPVFAFSTIETGFWVAQIGLHSDHPGLVIFSNTAPRGDIKWVGEDTQRFVCGILDNGIPIFAVNSGYNLSFVKEKLKGLWEVKVPNEGTQFRSRDYYPEAVMAILNGDISRVGKALDVKKIPDMPTFVVASVDGYGNLKTTIYRSQLSSTISVSKMLRISINGTSNFVLNTLTGIVGKTGDLCLVQGSSGGKKRPFLEIVKLQERAADAFKIRGPLDDLGKIEIEAVKKR